MYILLVMKLARINSRSESDEDSKISIFACPRFQETELCRSGNKLLRCKDVKIILICFNQVFS